MEVREALTQIEDACKELAKEVGLKYRFKWNAVPGAIQCGISFYGDKEVDFLIEIEKQGEDNAGYITIFLKPEPHVSKNIGNRLNPHGELKREVIYHIRRYLL